MKTIIKRFLICQVCILGVYWIHLSRQKSQLLVIQEENLLNGFTFNGFDDKDLMDTKSTQRYNRVNSFLLPDYSDHSRNCIHHKHTKLPLCKIRKSKCLQDSQKYYINYTAPSWDELIKTYSHFISGGSWTPCDCISQSKLAVIVPHNRSDVQIRIWLNNIIPFLIYQRRAFTLYLIGQNTDVLFNRGTLLNVGITEALKADPETDCFIFHDEAFLPESLCNLYSCSKKRARHLASAVDRNNYTLPHEFKLGGALALHKNIILSTNGFTNNLYHVGCENYNMYARLLCKNYTVERYDLNISRYTSLTNNDTSIQSHSDHSHYQCMHTWRYMKYDGLRSLNYSITSHTSIATSHSKTATSQTHFATSHKTADAITTNNAASRGVESSEDYNNPLFKRISVLINGPSNEEEATETYIKETTKFNDLLQNDTIEFERVSGILNEKDVLNTFVFSLRRGQHDSSIGIFKSFLSFVLGV